MNAQEKEAGQRQNDRESEDYQILDGSEAASANEVMQFPVESP